MQLNGSAVGEEVLAARANEHDPDILRTLLARSGCRPRTAQCVGEIAAWLR